MKWRDDYPLFLSQAAPILLEGECSIGGQEHLYMETQSSIVVPQENDEWSAFITVVASARRRFRKSRTLTIEA